MRRLSGAAVLGVVLGLVGVAGCDDDPAPPPADGGKTDALDGGTDGPAMCVGTFSALTRAGLMTATNPAGKCAADLDYICTGDIATKARACGTECATLPTPAAQLGCVTTCVATQTSISPNCASCYSALFACTLQLCPTCAQDPNSTACRTCQVTSGCMGTFGGCSGLPVGVPVPDGGTDAPADSAPDTTTETGTDVPVDAGVDSAPDAGADTADSAAAG